MINKFLKISQLLAITVSAFSFSNIFAEQLLLTDDQQESLAANVRDLGKELEKTIETDYDVLRDTVSAMKVTPATAGTTGGYKVLSRASASPDIRYKKFAQINANGSSTIVSGIDISTLSSGQSVTLPGFSGIYYEFGSAFANELLRGVKLLLIEEHGSFSLLTTHRNALSRDIKCFIQMDSLQNVASFSGESVSASNKVDLLKLTNIELDRVDYLKSCTRVNINVPTVFSEPDVSASVLNTLLQVTVVGM